ncbi:MAG: hypothetical protein GX192_03525 [Clostridiales bacterium]|nr:hypothetical protein [Clostridiales bacterium]
MAKNPQNYRTNKEKRLYIDECERRFEAEVDRAIRLITETDGIEIVTLSGPSCSGKTTTAKKLIWGVEAAGRRAHVVSIDDFYRDRSKIVWKVSSDGTMKPDYESVDSIDLDAVENFVRSMRAGGDLYSPVFNFAAGCATDVRKIEYRAGDIIIFEGIQAIYPEVRALFSGFKMRSVFISVADFLEVGGQVFSPVDIRLMRRLVRDYKYRGALADLTFYLWDDVRRNEIENIEPNAASCDVKINSLLEYEVGILKPYLFTVLGEISPDSPYIKKADEIIERLSDIIPIPSGLIPENSVYREFIH